MKTKILILGGTSHLNRGDHAMLIGLIKNIKQENSEDEIILYSSDPLESTNLYGIKCRWYPDSYFLSKTKRSRIVFLLRGLSLLINFILYRFTGRTLTNNGAVIGFYHNILEAKVVVIHGSGSFNSIWWHSWIYPKTFLLLVARLVKVPCVMISQGIGPITNRLDRMVSSVFFQMCNIIGTRDLDSIDRAMEIPLANQKKFVFTGDDALLMEPAAIPAALLPRFKSSNIRVGVNLRNSSSYATNYTTPNYDLYAKILDSVIEKYNCDIFFIPISYNSTDDDRESGASIAETMVHSARTFVIRDELKAAEIKGIIRQMNYCIGTSYHFLLFSLDSCIPSAGIYQDKYYETKIKGLFNLYETPSLAIDAKGLTLENAVAQISQLEINKSAISKHLKEVSSRLNRKSNKSRKAINELLH